MNNLSDLPLLIDSRSKCAAGAGAHLSAGARGAGGLWAAGSFHPFQCEPAASLYNKAAGDKRTFRAENKLFPML